MMGDHFNPKFLLIVSFILVSIIVAIIGLGVELGISSSIFYYFLFSINGLIQSAGWPAVVTIFSNWFGKKGRGTLIGLWSSSGNMGNVLGALMTSLFTSTCGLRWNIAFILVGTFCFLISMVNMCLLVVHPVEKDIVIDELDEHQNETERLLNATLNTHSELVPSI